MLHGFGILQGLFQLGQIPVDEGSLQFIAILEVPVQGPLADPGLQGNGIQGRAIAVPGENIRRGIQEGLSPSLRV